MSRRFRVLMTARVAAYVALLLLAGCASTVAVGTVGDHANQAALIEASSIYTKLAGTPNVTVTSIDGNAVDGTNFTVPAGQHTFQIHCSPGAHGLAFLSPGTDHKFTFDAESGHEYDFKADGQMLLGESCTPYVYDHTDGHEPEDETLDVPLDSIQGPWHEFSSAQAAGHYVHDFLPLDQYRLQKPILGSLMPNDAYARPGWQQMFEISSYIRLTYPGDAHAGFERA